MKTIELNEQQIQFIEDALLELSEQEDIGKTTLAIIDGIINKLNEE